MSWFSESDKDFDPSKLDPEARRAYEATKQHDRDLDPSLVKTNEELDKVRAAFKIEVLFGKDRTAQGPNTLVIQAWESGKHLHGGGDEFVYWCQDVREGEQTGCWGPIFGSDITSDMAYCRNCELGVRAGFLTGQRFMKVTTQRLAEHVAHIWYQLGGNADIYCKYQPGDFRYMTMEKKHGADKARKLRGLFIYPLGRILKDTSAGASLEGRLRAFFSA